MLASRGLWKNAAVGGQKNTWFRSGWLGELFSENPFPWPGAHGAGCGEQLGSGKDLFVCGLCATACCYSYF